MMNVYKYDFRINDYTSVNIPVGSKILKIDGQYNIPQLWALVDPTNDLEKREFRVAGTGHPISELPDEIEFIDTFQMHDGSLVFHVFELKK